MDSAARSKVSRAVRSTAASTKRPCRSTHRGRRVLENGKVTGEPTGQYLSRLTA